MGNDNPFTKHPEQADGVTLDVAGIRSTPARPDTSLFQVVHKISCCPVTTNAERLRH